MKFFAQTVEAAMGLVVRIVASIAVILFLFGMLSNGFGPHCYYSARGEEHCPSSDDE
jgi:hypothetical protein